MVEFMPIDLYPLVSIIVPVYNAAKYIELALWSLVRQDYVNIEIIVVDDGSTDGSDIIVSNFAKVHTSVHLFSQENQGACVARNRGYLEAKGKYIQYFDADDLLSPNKISEQVALLIGQPSTTIASSSFCRFDTDISTVCPKKQVIDKDYDNSLDWLIDSLHGKGMGQTSIWLLHRDICERIGPWDESLRKNQDGDYFTRAIINSTRIVYAERALVYYRSTQNSISKDSTWIAAESSLRSLEKYEKYATAFGEIDERLKNAFAHSFLIFIQYYYPRHVDLLERAERNIIRLGYSLNSFNGPGILHLMGKFIGMRNSLALRSILRRLLK